MRRLTIATVTALTAVAALTGCATSTGTAAPTTPNTHVSKTANATPSPSATDTAVADPKAVEPTTSAAPTVSALAQHIYDECSAGAADAGITLTLTETPTGYTSDGKYLLLYPFTFNDGHDDPYAIYNCALTDNTVNSTFIGGGLSDTH